MGQINFTKRLPKFTSEASFFFFFNIEDENEWGKSTEEIKNNSICNKWRKHTRTEETGENKRVWERKWRRITSTEMSAMHNELKGIKSPKYREKPVAELRTDLSFPESTLHWLARSAALAFQSLAEGGSLISCRHPENRSCFTIISLIVCKPIPKFH